MKYKVTAHVQSPGEEPVEIQWLKEGNALQAIRAVANELEEQEYTAANPDIYSPRTLSITIEVLS